MPYTAVAQSLKTLNEELLQEAYNYILYLQTKQNKDSLPQRNFGTLERKISAKFANDWEISEEELLGL